MKKVLFTIAGSMTISFGLFATKIVIVRTGSEDGIHYRYVRESHNGGDHQLNCVGKGKVECGWAQSPNRLKGQNKSYSSEELLSIADKEILRYFTPTDIESNPKGSLVTKIKIDGILITIEANKQSDGSIHSVIKMFDVDEPASKSF